MSAGLFVTIAGLIVAGVSALLGVWVGWDPQKPPRYAIALSVLILLSTAVSMTQAYLKARDGAKLEADIARILDDLDRMSGQDPAVDQYVSEEIRSQARSRPEVVNHLADRAEARGETIESLLTRRGLTAGDLEQLGMSAMTKATSMKAGEAGGTPAATEAAAAGAGD
jgi:hypothetical protein